MTKDNKQEENEKRTSSVYEITTDNDGSICTKITQHEPDKEELEKLASMGIGADGEYYDDSEYLWGGDTQDSTPVPVFGIKKGSAVKRLDTEPVFTQRTQVPDYDPLYKEEIALIYEGIVKGAKTEDDLKSFAELCGLQGLNTKVARVIYDEYFTQTDDEQREMTSPLPETPGLKGKTRATTSPGIGKPNDDAYKTIKRMDRLLDDIEKQSKE